MLDWGGALDDLTWVEEAGAEEDSGVVLVVLDGLAEELAGVVEGACEADAEDDVAFAAWVDAGAEVVVGSAWLESASMPTQSASNTKHVHKKETRAYRAYQIREDSKSQGAMNSAGEELGTMGAPSSMAMHRTKHQGRKPQCSMRLLRAQHWMVEAHAP